MKNIILLSDGTGNAASSVWRTNVWRMFQSLNLQADDQVAKYDDGVGTSSFLPLAILGGAFGWGLKRNVLDMYKFVCRNYESGDRIFMFGFSRGAFTVRVLAGLILHQGLIPKMSESQLHDQARKAYRAYRGGRYHSTLYLETPLRAIRDWGTSIRDALGQRRPYDRAENIAVPTIEFVGVWDTVAAYGLPTDEMTRGFSNWIWPLELPNRELSPRVNYARHALAIDDERTTFHPVLWNEPAEAVAADGAKRPTDQRLVQVWFAGMHSNVGGGYPDDALAYVPYLWMMREAAARGLIFKKQPDEDPDAVRAAQSARDKDGRLYDSRAGIGSYYRYGPRNIAALCNDTDHGVHVQTPKIHESVFGRIDSGCNAYAPIGLPSNYVVVTDGGQIIPPASGQFETSNQAADRVAIQDRIWNFVWLRRIAYFITLAATFHIVAFWLFHPLNAQHEFNSYFKLVSELVRLAESFLPGFVHWWADWYAGNPEWFAGGLIALGILLFWGSSLSARITDSMRAVWVSKGTANPIPNNGLQNAIYALRISGLYRWLIWVSRMHILPVLFALLFLWCALTFSNHLLFNVADSAGAFCHGDETKAKAVNLGIDQSGAAFETTTFCAATELKVRGGFRYLITIEVTDSWVDNMIPTSPLGFRTANQSWLTKPILYLAVPLRRIIFRPWNRLIARVGETGVDEYFLDPVRRSVATKDPQTKAVVRTRTNVFTDEFTANRDGEVFLYVNDAALTLPWLYDWFYRNNKGGAKISMRLL